jgi:LmbE family N-acetylglucosaminyl deacetylase
MLRARPAFSPILGAMLASGATVALLGYMLPTAPARADLLIVAPHPDDDLITSAGVILRARKAGETVWVLFMTNGDVLGMDSGLQRQNEAVDALGLLNVPEENIIFLGYPDGSLEDLRGSFLDTNTARAAGNRDAQTTTFGERGLGGMEYHRYIFEEHAANNGTNLRTDLAHVLSRYRPAHIFVTSEWDQHPDHRTAYRFVQDALAEARGATPSYNPTVHKTIVWNDFSNQLAWPAPANASAYFTEPPDLRTRTGLLWSERESLDVPLEMQVPTLTENLKWRAIDAHQTQGGNNGYIGQWVHKDEFFWVERAEAAGGNRPPVASAGADSRANRGARAQLDGSGSFDLDGDALVYHWRQRGEPSVTLASATTARPSFTVPRTVAEGTVFVFELSVSDGRTTSIADAVSVRAGGSVDPEPDAGAPRDAGIGPPPDASGAPGRDAGVADAASSTPDAATSDAAMGGPLAAGAVDAEREDAGSDAAVEEPYDPPEPGDDADGPAESDADGSATPREPAVSLTNDGGKSAHPTERGKRADSGCNARAAAAPERSWTSLLSVALGWLGLRRRRRVQYGS